MITYTRALLKRYQEETGSEDEHIVCDFTADLAHYCEEENVNLLQEFERGSEHFSEEIFGCRRDKSKFTPW